MVDLDPVSQTIFLKNLELLQWFILKIQVNTLPLFGQLEHYFDHYVKIVTYQNAKEKGKWKMWCLLYFGLVQHIQIMIPWYALSLTGAYDSTGEKLQIKGQCNLQFHMF